MHIIPLVLIILILVVILCIPSPVIPLCTGHAKQRKRSLGRETGTPDEEERLLSPDGEVASPRQDSQPWSPGDHTFSHLTDEIERLNRENARKAEEIEIARENVKRLQEDLSIADSQNGELQRRCETLLGGLEGARLFLSTADTFADSDVIQALQKLDAELQHTTTVMIDRIVNVFKLDITSSDPEQRVMDRVSEDIGSTLAKFLRTAGRDDSEGPMCLQIAFQAYLARYLCRVASSWTLDEGCNTFLSKLYQRLRDAEKQAISGRWRFLTQSHALPTCASDPSSLVPAVIAGLSDILSIAGYTGSRSHIVSELTSMFEDRILSAVSLAGSLNRMIGGVISGDFEVFVVRPGEAFRGEVMEDMDGSSGTGTAQTVLCTSEMGLLKRVRLGTGEKETTTVVKAKVIFESFLDTEDSG